MNKRWGIILSGLTALGILGLAGLFVHSLVLSHQGPLTEVEGIRSGFLKRYSPVGNLSLEELTQSKFGRELIEPETALPRTYLHPFREISPLYRYAVTCRNPPRLPVTSPLNKALHWHQFLCGGMNALPSLFFSQPPYLHPSGSSFAKLAYELGGPNFKTKDWLNQHRKYLHLSELTAYEKELGGLSFSEQLLAHLPADSLTSLLANQSPVLAKNYIFFRDRPRSEGDLAHRFQAFPIATWNKYLSNIPFDFVAAKAGPLCAVTEGNGCWQYRPERELPFRLLLTLLFCSIFVLAGLLLLSAYQRKRDERKEHEARLFLLQTLTHEIRTPATGLRLTLESLRRDFDQLPEKAQTNLLRMSDEIHRLIRVVEGSKTYLNTEQGRIRLRCIDLDSLNDYVETLLEPFFANHGDSLKFVPLAQDASVNLDQYWMSLCIKNLVENAFNHGVRPVTVALTREGRKIRIAVTDQGQSRHRKLQDLIRSRVPGGTPKGLGLGLSLVQRVATLMNVRMEFSPEPTTFSILVGNPI